MHIKTDLTADEVRGLFDYDPITGQLIRKITTGTTAKAGSVAGSVNTLGYLTIRIRGKLYLVHRIIWLHVTGHWPKDFIDHVNGDPSDNKFSNLREAESYQNLGNTQKRADNTSGVKGVSWCKSKQKWEAYITISSRKKSLGRFSSIEAAAEAYQIAATARFGEFARFE